MSKAWTEFPFRLFFEKTGWKIPLENTGLWSVLFAGTIKNAYLCISCKKHTEYWE